MHASVIHDVRLSWAMTSEWRGAKPARSSSFSCLGIDSAATEALRR